MSHWLYPANVKLYDVLGAFSKPYAIWPISTRVSVNDIVYIYLSAPFKQVGFVCSVQEVDLPGAAVVDETTPYFRKEPSKISASKLFMKLRIVSRVDIDSESPLSYRFLKMNGLNGALMGPRKLENNPELHAYIDEVL